MHAKEEGLKMWERIKGRQSMIKTKKLGHFKTSREAVRKCRDRNFKMRRTESDLCHAMCCIARPFQGPCGPC